MIQILGAMLLAWTAHMFIKEVIRTYPGRRLAKAELRRTLKVFNGRRR